MAVHLDHGRSLAAWRAMYQQGRTWEPSPYSYELASKHMDLSWTVDHKEPSFVRLARRGLLKLLGFDLVHAWRNRAVILKADVVWTHTEREHLAVLALALASGRRTAPKVVAQSVWLYERGRLTWLQRYLLSHASVELVHSRVNLAIARRLRRDAPIFLCPFGTATPDVQSRPTISEVSRPRVLAPGNDRDRDWGVMVAAAGLLPDVDFVIAADPRKVRIRRKPKNVQVKRFASVQALSDAYRSASIVVIPLRANTHASGATVAMEAARFGRPIVAPEAGGLEDYLPRDGWHIYKEGDVDSLVRAIESGIRDRPRLGDGLQTRGLTAQDYVNRYLLATRFVLGDKYDPQLSRFSPVRYVER